MKKLLALTLALLMAASLFAGGGQQGGSSGGPTEIEVWVYEEFYRDGEASAIGQSTKAFTTANPNIKVTITPIPAGSSSFRDKFIQAANGGSGPDVILSDNVWVPQLAAMELIIPLTKYLGNKKNEFFPGPIQAATLNNEIYAIPFHSDAMVLYYNKDMFRAAGLDPEKPPKTWEEFRDYSIKLTRNGKAGYGLLGGWGGSFEWLPWFWQNGAEIIGADGKVAFNSAAGLEATEFFLNLLVKDKVIPEAALTWKSWDELAVGFANQTFAMAEGMDVMLQLLARQQINFDWGVAELPSRKNKASTLGGGHWAVNKNSKNYDAAYKWIDFISSKDQNLKIMDAYFRTSSRVDAGEQAIIKSDPKKQMCVAALAYARPRPIIPEWTVIDYDCLQPAFMKVIFEGQAIRPAMQRAEEQANAALAD
jgi:multiple sugar transport system substrate-binding protein